jgi:hypothetical protein
VESVADLWQHSSHANVSISTREQHSTIRPIESCRMSQNFKGLDRLRWRQAPNKLMLIIAEAPAGRLEGRISHLSSSLHDNYDALEDAFEVIFGLVGPPATPCLAKRNSCSLRTKGQRNYQTSLNISEGVFGNPLRLWEDRDCERLDEKGEGVILFMPSF